MESRVDDLTEQLLLKDWSDGGQIMQMVLVLGGDDSSCRAE